MGCANVTGTACIPCRSCGSPSINREETWALAEDSLTFCSDWVQGQGEILEPPLRKGLLQLVDAKWLIGLAAQRKTLVRRQDLPPEAYVSVDDLSKEHFGRGGSLRILVLSYPWLTPAHPDPHGETLRYISPVLQAFMASGAAGACGGWGVLIDFCALPQKPYNETKGEKELFKKGLPVLNLFYGHPRTVVLKVTTFPPGYPHDKRYGLPPDAKKTPYMERGWCYAESSMSGLVKDYDFVLDLAKLSPKQRDLEDVVTQCCCKSGRAPPLLPEGFRKELSKKTFTNKKSDFDGVYQLYADAFQAHFSTASELNYTGLGWKDQDVKVLVRVLRSRHCKAETIRLVGNPIGDEGAEELAKVLQEKPSIQRIVLRDDSVYPNFDTGVSAQMAEKLKMDTKGKLVI